MSQSVSMIIESSLYSCEFTYKQNELIKHNLILNKDSHLHCLQSRNIGKNNYGIELNKILFHIFSIY